MSGRWPSFLLVGAARSGTTALFTFLGRHPEIFTPPLKEPHFFAFRDTAVRFHGTGDDRMINRRIVTDEAAYRQLFAGASPGQQAGEASVSYLYYPRAPREIRRAIPEVKILVILRDPVERAFSNYQYMLAGARESARTFCEALELEDQRIRDGWEHIWHYRHLGYYHEQLLRFYQTFDRAQIHVVLHEDLRDSPGPTLASVFEFLGVGARAAIDTDRAINVSGRPRSQVLTRWLARSPLKGALLGIVPDRWRERIVSPLRRAILRRESVPAAAAVRLRDEYRAGVIALAELIGRDLGAWLGAPEPALADSALPPR